MPRAVRFDHYGGVDVLQVVEIDQPHPGPGEVVVRVIAAATNPGEMMIREGAFADVWPATFPEGQGNDFSGRVAEIGPGETRFSPGDEVIGFLPRAAQADYVVSPSDRLARKPPGLPWEVAATIPAAVPSSVTPSTNQRRRRTAPRMRRQSGSAATRGRDASYGREGRRSGSGATSST